MTKTSVQKILINEDHVDQRIDNFLFTRFKTIPKTHIYRILRKGEVRVNKKRIQASYRLQEKDELRIPPLEIEEKAKTQSPSHRLISLLKKRILFEDNNLLIINKPSGIPVHGGTEVSLGVIDALRVIFPKANLQLAHRLDRETSGCLILAKKRSVLRELHELMRENKVVKKYLALTSGHWKPNELRVDVSLLKNHLSSGERIVKVNKEGKESLTVFKVIEKFKDCELVEATLHTGRTHQIRVHAQYRKHPLACDEKYGDKLFNKKIRELGLKRLYLHAIELQFTLPSTQQKIAVKAELDKELKEITQELSL